MMSRPMLTRVAPSCSWLSCVVVLGGCRGCREGHPYVPYSIAPESVAVEPTQTFDSAVPSSSAAPSSRFTSEAATAAPPGRSQWSPDGMTLTAAEGRVFVSGIVRAFEGEGPKSAYAIVRSAAGDDPGELEYFRAVDGHESLALVSAIPPPELSARTPDCAPVARLTTISRRTVLVDLGSRCPAHSGRGSRRWVAIVTTRDAKPALRMAFTIAAAAPDLRVDGEELDLDGDGVDDISLRIGLDDASLPARLVPAVFASVAWLDRPAGLSQNVAVTESSFAGLAGSAMSRAARLKDALGVPAWSAQVRALYRAVCAEGGSPSMAAIFGAGIVECGSGRPLEELGLSDVRAFVTEGDGLRAALALDRAGRAPATRTPARAAEAMTWLLKAAPVASAHAVRAIAAVPNVPAAHVPTWGPLAFESNGKLLVATKAGVARVDPDAGDEAAAEDVPAWPSFVSSPDGALRWRDVFDACDDSPLRARFTTQAGEEAGDVMIPVPPPLGESCSLPHRADVRVAPISWDKSGLQAIIDGTTVLVSPNLAGAAVLTTLLDAAPRRGGPQSPDAGALVVAVGPGLAVRAGGSDRLFRAQELEGTYEHQQYCAISGDHLHVACIHDSKAWVGSWK